MTPFRSQRPVPSWAPLTLTIAVSVASRPARWALVPFLAGRGHEVKRLVRTAPKNPNEIAWDPARRLLDADDLEGVDAVIHLAVEPISERWTTAAKARIRESR